MTSTKPEKLDTTMKITRRSKMYRFDPNSARFNVTIRDENNDVIYYDEGRALALVVQKKIKPKGVAHNICSLATDKDKLIMAGDLIESALKDALKDKPKHLKAVYVVDALQSLSEQIIQNLIGGKDNAE